MNRSRKQHSHRRFLVPRAIGPLLLSGFLLACGGGTSAEHGGQQPATAAPTGGGAPTQDEGAPAAEGPITGFGSVWVGGVRFDTTGAKVEIDGRAGTEDELEVGMVVSVDGHIDADDPRRGVARRITQDSHLSGTVREIASDGSRMVVGQAVVLLSETTVYRGSPADLLQLGASVVVSGHPSPAGLVASFVGARTDHGQADRLRGIVAALDETRLQFRLGDTVVDYSAAALIETRDGLANGDPVICQGRWQRDAAVFVATHIRELARDERPGQRPVRLRGVIEEEVTAGRAWRIGDTIFVVSASTEYRNGSARQLRVGAEVLVSGHGSLHGRVHADTVAFFPQVNGAVEAAVESVDRARRTITVLGGLTIVVPEDTSITATEEPSAATAADGDRARRLDLDDVAEGHAVRAVGDWNGTVLIARRLQRAPFEGRRAFLGGRLERVAPDQREFSLLGVRVAVTGDTDFGDGSAAAFFADAEPGDRVAVLGAWDGERVLAGVVRHGHDDHQRIDRVSDARRAPDSRPQGDGHK